jgi:hypothetical protein
VVSIASMNFSIKLNSIGFYQMFKLLCIPYILYYNNQINHQTYSSQTLLSVGILIFGVFLFFASDPELNFSGTIYAMLAVVSASHHQIFTGNFKRNFTSIVQSFNLQSDLNKPLLGLPFQVCLSALAKTMFLKIKSQFGRYC